MESFDSLPTAADYAQSAANEAKATANNALKESANNGRILDEIHTISLAMLLGFYGEKKAKELVRYANELKRNRIF